jgi:hypothetical protein
VPKSRLAATLGRLITLGNLLGGLLAFFYFRFIDTVASSQPS